MCADSLEILLRFFFGNVFDHYRIFVPFGHVSFYGCLCCGLFLCQRIKNLSFFTLFSTTICAISRNERLVKFKSISIFKIDFKPNVCSLMRNHSSLDCKLVYDYNTAVDLFCICSIHQWAKCIGTSSTLYVRGTV